MTDLNTELLKFNGKVGPQYLDEDDKSGGLDGTMKPITKEVLEEMIVTNFPAEQNVSDTGAKAELEAIKQAQAENGSLVLGELRELNANNGIALTAYDKSVEALNKSELTQTQLDTVVIEGDSSVEAAQARVEADGTTNTTLKARLDKKDAELAQEIDEVTQQLADTERQTQTLQTGLNVINADVVTPVDFEIQGRTLVNLLGTDGNFEKGTNSLGAGWVNITSAIFSREPNGIYDKYTQRITSIGQVNSRVEKQNMKFEAGKYYVVLVDANTGIGATGQLRIDIGSESFTKNITSGGAYYRKFTPEVSANNGYVRLYNTSTALDVWIEFDGVRLYEISQSEYDKIGIEWDDAEVTRRYPYVDGVKHLVNPYVMAEGANLLEQSDDAINAFEHITTQAKNKMITGTKFEVFIGNQVSHGNGYVVDTVVGQDYAISCDVTVAKNLTNGILRVGTSGTDISLMNVTGDGNGTIKGTFKATSTKTYIKFLRQGGNSATDPVYFDNVILSIGTVPKPFVPQNKSYIYADVKLGAIGDKKDILYKQDGQWKVRKSVEKDVVLDGKLPYVNATVYEGHRRVDITSFPGNASGTGTVGVMTRPDGYLLSKYIDGWNKADLFLFNGVNFVLTVSNVDSGFTVGLTPTTNDWKRYFNGWKYTDGTTWTSVTGNGQTATAQQALDTKPSDYVPYRLSYALAKPVVEDVRVEGDIYADGLTQVEVGSGVIVREKFEPVRSGTRYYTNLTNINSELNHRVDKFLGIYRNKEIDTLWKTGSSNIYKYGNDYAHIEEKYFDLTADYYVTYMVLDKHELTTNPIDVKARYAKNLRTAHDEVAVKVSDIATDVSINIRSIAEMYKRIRNLEGV